MRIPRVRFTVRRMMVAVAVAGIICGALVWLAARSRRMAALADYHYLETEKHMVGTVLGPNTFKLEYNADGLRHLMISNKYRRAARYPFLPVWPDPPEPE